MSGPSLLIYTGKNSRNATVVKSNYTEHTQPLHFNLQHLTTLLTLLYAVHNEYATLDKKSYNAK